MIRSLPFALGLACALTTVQPLFADEPAQRVVSIGGSVTEIAVALGAEDRLIARDSTSSFPDSITDLPDVGYVRALSPEGVLALGPDLIIAEHDAGPVEAVDVLRAAGVPFVIMPGDPTVDGIRAKILAVADALDLPAEGAALADQVEADLAAQAKLAATVAEPKRVLFVLSAQGGRIMAGGDGSSADGIIRLAGGVNAASGFAGFKQMTDEAVLTAAPDAIVMMDRGGDHSVQDAELFALPSLASSPAAASGKIIRMNGLLLLGFGPRTAEAARSLHDALYGSGN
ncbi:MAG: ABC transporter substrate-binding protein [Rhodobacteraceae bacterium]|nr:ABC transporter substrate-binding protein [Paracoccaceae bacterium]